MRTELAFQWGLVEDEIPTVFEKLFKSIRACLLNLQSHLRGKSLRKSKVNRAALTIGLGSEQGFASALVQGIDFRVQDLEYKFSLVRQDFAREVKYARFHFTHFSASQTLSRRSMYYC